MYGTGSLCHADRLLEQIHAGTVMLFNTERNCSERNSSLGSRPDDSISIPISRPIA